MARSAHTLSWAATPSGDGTSAARFQVFRRSESAGRGSAEHSDAYASYWVEVFPDSGDEAKAVFERGGGDQCVGQPGSELADDPPGSFGDRPVHVEFT